MGGSDRPVPLPGGGGEKEAGWDYILVVHGFPHSPVMFTPTLVQWVAH